MINNKIFEEAANLNNLGERWLRVTEGYRKQRDELRKDAEELRASAKTLESVIERRDEKYEELVLRNRALTNFIHEQRIAASRVHGISRNAGVGDAKESKTKSTRKWRRCLPPGCKYRELAKNNNIARHFRRAHPKNPFQYLLMNECWMSSRQRSEDKDQQTYKKLSKKIILFVFNTNVNKVITL